MGKIRKREQENVPVKPRRGSREGQSSRVAKTFFPRRLRLVCPENKAAIKHSRIVPFPPWDNYSFYSFRNPVLCAAVLLSRAEAWSVKLANLSSWRRTSYLFSEDKQKCSSQRGSLASSHRAFCFVTSSYTVTPRQETLGPLFSVIKAWPMICCPAFIPSGDLFISSKSYKSPQVRMLPFW